MSCNYQCWLSDELFCVPAFSQDEIPYFVPAGCQERVEGGFHPNREEEEKRNEGGNYFIYLLRCWRESRCGKLLARGGITASMVGLVCC